MTTHVGGTEHWVLSPQGSTAGKKYKFVVTGHGKYEKIPVDDENGEEFTNGKCGTMTDLLLLKPK